MKVINIGLSVLLSMGLAISPLYANDDVSLEETEVEKEDSNTEVEAYAQEKSVLYTLSTSDGITDYILNNGDTKTVRLKVTDEKGQEQIIIRIVWLIIVRIYMLQIKMVKFHIMWISLGI